MISNIRNYLFKKILPKKSYEIGFRQQLAAKLSLQNHYTISFHTEGEIDPELSYFILNEEGLASPNVFFTGEPP